MATFKFTAGGDLLIGTEADDTFTTTDTDIGFLDVALGNGGNDTILVNTVGASTIADVQFTGVHGVENLVYSNKVTSVDLSTGGATIGKAGINHVDASLVSGDANISFSLDTSGPVRIDGSLGANSITGTAFNDRVRIKADTFTNDGVSLGNHVTVGTNADLYALQGDVLELYSAKAFTLNNDALFAGVHAQTLALSGTGPFTVTLGKATQASGITHGRCRRRHRQHSD
jgi:hypothetical protein